MAEERSHRLFFAFWPSPELQADLARAVRKVARTCGGRPIPPENFHVTVAFLGSVPGARLPELEPIAARVAMSGQPFSLTLDRLEYWHKAQLLCATASATPPVAITLATALKRELTDAGFAPDLKPFRAHVTLARKVSRLTRQLDVHSVVWTFDALSLIESETRPEGSLYSVLKSWTLCGPRAS